MARNDVATDESARERESDESLLDRRSYLRLAGATAATVAGAGVAASAETSSYDTITIPAGEGRVFDASDFTNGEFSNKLIDISADGAAFRIRPPSGNWTIRNVGVKGQYPLKSNDPFGSDQAIIIMNDDAGGTSRIENCYFGDGGRMNADAYAQSALMMTTGSHSGELHIENVYCRNWLNNAVYAAYHAMDGYGGGTVHVADSYFENNGVASVRVAGNGSTVTNTVVNGGPHRGFWVWGGRVSFQNCDANMPNGRCWEVGQQNHPTDPAVAAVTDCRAAGSRITKTNGGSVEGTFGSNPRTSPPSGVPASAEEAASGQSGSSSDSTTTEDGTQQTSDQQGTLLELVAGADTSGVSYEFTVEGSVRKHSSGTDPVAEGNDSVTDNGDGTVTVTGTSGNGYGDAYYVDGTITSMNLDGSKWTIRYGGTEVSASDLALPNKLVIDGSDAPRRVSNYTFTVSGAAEKNPASGSVNAYDTISSGEISGRVVGGKDAYRYSGEITGFSLDGPATVHVEDDS